jgi:hypothetical protein
MNVVPEVCKPSAWADLRTASKAQLTALQHYFDRRNLEGSLAALIEAARGHKAQGRPAGSPVYVVLHRESLLLVEAYSKRWGTNLEQLYAEIPGFNMLRELARSRSRPSPLLTAVLVVIAVVGSAFVFGLVGAAMHLGYELFGGAR